MWQVIASSLNNIVSLFPSTRNLFYIESQLLQDNIYNENELNLIKSYNSVVDETAGSQFLIWTKFKSINLSSQPADEIFEVALKQKHVLENIYHRTTTLKAKAQSCFDDAIITTENCEKRVKACENEISTLTNTANYHQQQINNLKSEIQRKQMEYNNEKEEYDKLERRNNRCENVEVSAFIAGGLLSPLVLFFPPAAIAIAGTVAATVGITSALRASQEKIDDIKNKMNSLNNSIQRSNNEKYEVEKRLQEAIAAKNVTNETVKNERKKPEFFRKIIVSLAEIQNYIEARQIPLDEIIRYYSFHASLPKPPTPELCQQQNENFLNNVRNVYQTHSDVIDTLFIKW